MIEEFRVGVIGAGYVGLVTGACLAHVGHRVVCVDKNQARVSGLEKGFMPIYEPNLEEMVARGTGRGRLSFSADLPEMVRRSDIVFIAVDTPQGEDGAADLSSVAAVARSIGRALAEPMAEPGARREHPLVVVNKSTVPVGSGDYVSMLVQEGADVSSVASGMGLDERIGPRFLSAGIGWGGSCFPKDVSALRSIAREYDYVPAILDAAVAVNARQRKRVISKLQRDLHTLKGKRVALLGLAFKPNTDDLREAPSLEIARALDSLGARVVGYDPVAGKAAANRLDLKVVFDPYEALSGAHAAVLVTEWEELRTLDLDRVSGLMEAPKLLVDGRNVLDAVAARDSGLLYRGFGRTGHYSQITTEPVSRR